MARGTRRSAPGLKMCTPPVVSGIETEGEEIAPRVGDALIAGNQALVKRRRQRFCRQLEDARQKICSRQLRKEIAAIGIGRHENPCLHGPIRPRSSTGTGMSKWTFAGGLLAHPTKKLGLHDIPPIEYAWSGMAVVAPDFLPHLVELGPGTIAGFAGNARGIAMTTAMGGVVADWAAGADPDSLPIPYAAPGSIPFHALLKHAPNAMLSRAGCATGWTSWTRPSQDAIENHHVNGWEGTWLSSFTSALSHVS